MVQFHPTALDVAEVGNPAGAGGRPLPLVTEALRGEGAVLLDGRGRRFMLDEHPEAELAPRDIVARALWRRRAAGETVYLDATEAVGEAFPKRFPTVYRLCREHGVDPRREPIPVTPAAHFHMGGIAVDDQGRSSLEGLWACGEVACTGVHGANRLASNSLLEGLVFGRTLGRRAVEAVAECEVPSPALHLHLAREAFRALPPVLSPGSAEAREEGELILRIRTALWRHVGLIRDQGSLRRALGLLGRLAWRAGRSDPRLRNLHQVARLVTLAALERRESRGGHFRSDYPVPDPSWRRRIFVTGGSAPEVEPGPPLPAPGPEAVPALPRWSAEAPR